MGSPRPLSYPPLIGSKCSLSFSFPSELIVVFLYSSLIPSILFLFQIFPQLFAVQNVSCLSSCYIYNPIFPRCSSFFLVSQVIFFLPLSLAGFCNFCNFSFISVVYCFSVLSALFSLAPSSSIDNKMCFIEKQNKFFELYFSNGNTILQNQ